MNGMQAPQMPGQAAMPVQPQMMGIRQQPQGPKQDVPAFVPQMQQIDPSQLTAVVEQARSKPSSEGWAALAALLEELKSQEYVAAVARQNAMQQNTQQPPGTVADQLLAAAQQMRRPVRAAYGGLMRGYSGGGIVAFADGDAIWKKRLIEQGVPEPFIAGLESRGASPEAIAAEARRSGYMSAQTSPVADQTYIPPSQGITATEPVREAYRPSMNYGERYVRPETQAKQTRSVTSTPTPGNKQMLPALPTKADRSELTEERERALQAQADVPEDVSKGRADLARMIAEDLRRRETDIETRKATETERLNKALADSSTYGAMDYFALAKALGGAKKGQVFGKLGEGLYGVEARKKAEQEAARKAFNDAENLRRTEFNLLQKERALEQQRDLAIKERDVTTANEIQGKIYALRKERMDVADTAEQKEFENALALDKARREQEDVETRRIAAKTKETDKGEKRKLTPAQLMQMRLSAERQVDAALKNDLNYRKLSKDPDAQKTYRDKMVEERVADALAQAGIEPPTSTVRPPAATTMPSGNWGTAQVVKP